MGTEGYHEDLAYIHDVGFGGFAEEAAPGLLGILREHGISGGLVVDLGCGSGIWARSLVDAGYDVLGIDISPAMLDIARKRVPEAEFRNESFLTAELPSCNAVTALGEVLNYTFDPENSLDALSELFHRIYRSLRPGGVFVFDILETGYLDTIECWSRSTEGEDWAVLVRYEADRERETLTRFITTFRKVDTLYRRDHEIHRVQIFKASDITDALCRSGFRVTLLHSYGDMQFRKGLVGFVAERSI